MTKKKTLITTIKRELENQREQRQDKIRHMILVNEQDELLIARETKDIQSRENHIRSLRLEQAEHKAKILRLTQEMDALDQYARYILNRHQS